MRAEISISLFATDASILAEREQDIRAPVVFDTVVQRTAPRVEKIAFADIRPQPLRPGFKRFKKLFKIVRVHTDIRAVLIDRCSGYLELHLGESMSVMNIVPAANNEDIEEQSRK